MTGASAALPRRAPVPWRWLAPAAAVVVASALPWVADAYVLAVATHALIAVPLAASAYFLLGVVGLPSLGQVAYLGVGAYAAALVGRELHAVVVVQLVCAVVAAAMIASAVGSVLTLARGLPFLMLTLLAAELMRTGIEHAPWLGGGNGLSVPSAPVLPGLPVTRGDLTVYVYVTCAATALLGVLAILLRTRAALVLRGIADNEKRMQANGYNPHRHLWAAYVVAAAIAGAAGALHIAAYRYVAPAEIGFTSSALALLAATIGRASLERTCAAAVVIAVVADVGGSVISGYRPVLLGLLFLGAAYVGHIGRRS